MKFLAVTFFVGLIVLVKCMDDEWMEKLKQFKTDCIAESGIDKDVAMEAEKGHYGDDSKSKAYFLCFMKKTGFVNGAGEYQIDVIKKRVMEKYDEATADKYISECTKEDHGNPEDNALHLVKCYHENVLKDKQ